MTNEHRKPEAVAGAGDSAHSSAPRDDEGWFYESPGAGLNAVKGSFDYWSGRITESSATLAIAVIAGNWAIFGSVEKILRNDWSRWSLISVILALGINLYGMRHLSEAHRKRMDWGEEHRDEWIKEFNETKGRRGAWPYTKSILFWSRLFRECRTWLPLIGGILFLIALFKIT